MRDKEAFKQTVEAMKTNTDNAKLLLKAFTKQKWINFLYFFCGVLGSALSYLFK